MYVVEPMALEDIDEIVEIEREAFSLTWPANAHRRELRENRLARYVVVRNEPDPGPPPGCTPAGRSDDEGGFGRLLDRILHRSTGNGAARADGRSSRPRAPILGYAGLWLMADEAHVTTIATRADQRGKGLGELLLVALFRIAETAGAAQLTLEVRVSNTVAQALYHKYGFTVHGTRRRYYSDNGEDALIMWSEPLTAPAWRARLAGLVGELSRRLGQPVDEIALAPLRSGGTRNL